MIKTLLVALSLLPFFQEAPQSEPVFVTLGISTPGGIMAAQRILFLEFIPADGKVTVRRTVGTEAAETATLDPAGYDALLKDIATVWDLPTENPKDGEDIYGMNTGIQLRRGSRSWVNGAPSGCIHIASTVKPTDAQRKEFARVVERIMDAAECALPTTKIRLTEGFVGGKRAPMNSLVLTFEPKAGAVSVVRTVKSPNGESVVRTGTMTPAEYHALVTSIKGIFNLPVEEPRGCQDIYALDTGILVVAGRKKWGNTAPGGCTDHGISTVIPSAAQVGEFAGYVELIKKEAERRAPTKP